MAHRQADMGENEGTLRAVGCCDADRGLSVGKAAATLLMFAGITVFGVITANMAAWFTRSKEEAENDDLARQVEELTAAVERLVERIEEAETPADRG